MTTCPVCSGPLITANAGTVLYCAKCAAEGRPPVIERTGASVPGSGAKAAVRGVQAAQGVGQRAERNKFGAVPEVVDGHRFASGGEARRYRVLKLRQAAGEISGLRLQPAYPLTINGKSVGKYVADFTYLEDGNQIVEDFKGVRTPIFRLKKRMMKVIHGIEILETR